MGKRLSVQEIKFSGDFNFALQPKTVCVAVRCLGSSANRLYIGVNEDALGKNYLDQGESIPYGPYRTDDYLSGELRFKFELADPNNAALLIVTTEAGEIC